MEYNAQNLRVFVELTPLEMAVLIAPLDVEEVLALSESTEWVISDHE